MTTLTPSQNTKNIHMISLGCARNLVDSENMLGLLNEERLYSITEDPSSAEIIIINTCGFIDAAKKESVDTILEAAEQKKSGKCKHLVVTGCLSERYPQELHDSIPEIDLITGTAAFSQIVSELEKLPDFEHTQNKISKEHERLKDYDLPRVNTLSKTSAYLKLAEGCAKRCSFCIIPKLRGKLRSRSMESLIEEAKKLTDSGVIELNLIAQDLTDYGRDRKDGAQLSLLLKKLCALEKLQWLRLFYVYPDQFSEDVLETIAEEKKICKYMDVPVQHISNSILRSMNRHTSGEQIKSMIVKMKERIPDLILRTSLMVGFPGETEENFQELCDFVQEGHFDHLGVFTYSHEEGTASSQFPDNISSEEKKRRQEKLYQIQSDVLKAKLPQWKNKTVDVLIEGYHDDTELLLKGRHYGQAPDVDNQTIINDGTAQIGSIQKVHIQEIVGPDLMGSIV